MRAHSTAAPAARNDDRARLDTPARRRDRSTLVRAPWSLGLVLVLAARLVPAAQPCPDEPGLDGLACRVDALGARGRRGEPAAHRRAHGVRRRPHRGRDPRAPRHGPAARARSATTRTWRSTDALRRATIDRLRRHPCPELVEVLSPRRGERIPHGDLFVLLRLAAGRRPRDALPSSSTTILPSPSTPAPSPTPRRGPGSAATARCASST